MLVPQLTAETPELREGKEWMLLVWCRVPCNLDTADGCRKAPAAMDVDEDGWVHTVGDRQIA